MTSQEAQIVREFPVEKEYKASNNQYLGRKNVHVLL